MSVRTSGSPWYPTQQLEAEISQANPVSGTIYPVIAGTYVRVISINVWIVWAVTQPNISAVCVVDGQTMIFTFATPGSNVDYFASWVANIDLNNMVLETTDRSRTGRPFLFEGRNVTVGVRSVWAITQPDPLNCRVHWARLD